MPYEKVGDNEPVCIADEVPFEIPESWEWCRLNTISYLVGNKNNQIKTVEIKKVGKVPVVSQGQALIDGYSDDIHKIINDLPLIMFGDHTKNIKYIDFPFIIGADGTKFHKIIFCDIKFIYYWMSYITINMLNRGYARHHALLLKEFLPLPPLREQEKIVCEIEKYLPLIDKYDSLETELNKLNAEFPEKLKKSILQQAIQGKLVEQNSSDEPASVLLEKIRKEKEKLIKEGKIKKDKNESIIYKRDNSYYEKLNGVEKCIDDEIPFEIPESWEWVRLRNVVYNHGQLKPNEDFCYIDIGSIDNKHQKLNSVDTILSYENAPSRARKKIEYGDIIYSTVRPYLHNMCIIDRKFNFLPIASTGFAVMACFRPIVNKYLFYYLLSPFFDNYANNQDNSKGVAYPAINDEKLYRSLFPLPSLNNQNKIINIITRLFDAIHNLIK